MTPHHNTARKLYSSCRNLIDKQGRLANIFKIDRWQLRNGTQADSKLWPTNYVRTTEHCRLPELMLTHANDWTYSICHSKVLQHVATVCFSLYFPWAPILAGVPLNSVLEHQSLLEHSFNYCNTPKFSTCTHKQERRSNLSTWALILAGSKPRNSVL